MMALFILSGAGSLIAQVSYAKYLTAIVGATAYAASAVLAAFMTGLAAGAALGGRLSRRLRRPIAAYAVAEFVAAAAVAAGPFAFDALTPAYVSLTSELPRSIPMLSLARWVLALSLVLIPTTAMGATLPILTAGLGTERQRKPRLGALYATNTLGGALGALAGAYLVIPSLGLTRSLMAAASCSALAGFGALALFALRPRLGSRGAVHSDPGPLSVATRDSTETRDGSAPPPLRRTNPDARSALAALAFVSGTAVFASEVVSTHLLAVVIGNSAYAFAVILAIFLACLFTAASLAAQAHRRWPNTALPLSLVASGFCTLALLPAWDDLPSVFANLGESVPSFAGRELVRGAVASTILFLPTTLMGFTFPLLLQRVASERNAGSLVGWLTAINTCGAVIGALVTGYVILPRLGSEHTLTILALFLVAAGLMAPRPGSRFRRFSGAVLATTIAAALCKLPGWDPLQLTAGTNVYFDAPREPERLLFWREDVHGGITTVTVNASNVKTLYTNGKFQGNSGWELQAQRLFAHYPSLFVEEFDRALVIGLGTGTTLGTLAAYPWRRLHVVEISPAIAEAAATHFPDINGNALADPRVSMHFDDGRNYLLLDSKKYDLISIELSSIWFAGAASLYTQEFYASVAAHLKARGVFQQWVQLHHIHRRDFASILETVLAEFDSALLFYGGGQGIVVAANHPLVASAAHLARLEKLQGIRAVRPTGRSLADLLDDLLLTDKGLEAWLQDTATRGGFARRQNVATDDNLYLEYATPRGNILPWETRESLVAELIQYRHPTALRAVAETTPAANP